MEDIMEIDKDYVYDFVSNKYIEHLEFYLDELAIEKLKEQVYDSNWGFIQEEYRLYNLKKDRITVLSMYGYGPKNKSVDRVAN